MCLSWFDLCLSGCCCPIGLCSSGKWKAYLALTTEMISFMGVYRLTSMVYFDKCKGTDSKISQTDTEI